MKKLKASIRLAELASKWPNDFWSKLCKAMPTSFTEVNATPRIRGHYLIDGKVLFVVRTGISTSDLTCQVFYLTIPASTPVPQGALNIFLKDIESAGRKIGVTKVRTPEEVVSGTYMIGRTKDGLQLRARI